MTNRTMRLAVLALPLIAFASSGVAGDRPDLGKMEYESNCVACHGLDGRGGAYPDFLKTTPPDLSTLTGRNGGVFPFERVYQVIDGREMVRSHGARDMPIWGKDYQRKAAEYYIDVNYDPEAYVRTRILALIDYLNRLQRR